jgi:4-carboxymuconolactone decarboxylase
VTGRVSRSPRIAPLADPPPDTQAVLDKGLQYLGRPLHVPATLAHHPLLLKRFTQFAGLFLADSLLPDRDRELLTLRATYRAGVEYYFGHHQRLAPAAGVSDAEIEAVIDETAAWSGRDATLMAFADQLTAGTTVDDATWAALRAFYDEAQALEATILVGFYRMMAGFVNTIGVEREPAVPGWFTSA